MADDIDQICQASGQAETLSNTLPSTGQYTSPEEHLLT